MNWDQVTGKWEQLKGEVKTKWAKLTNDDLVAVEGHRDRLVGKIQERYGVMKEQAEREVDEWVTRASNRIDAMGDKTRV